MCWICVAAPIDFVSNNDSDKDYPLTGQKMRKIDRLKNVLRILSEQPGIEYCSEGSEQIKILKNMQYELGREF